MAYASHALTDTETRYAQIEKELLTFIFACERFEPYIYSRDLIQVESDHKPLEAIFCKPLHSAPKGLQLQLQNYSLCVTYKKGQDMFLSDTLSRAFLPEVNTYVFTKELEEMDHRAFLTVSHECWQQIKHASANDLVLQQLRATIQRGWPETRSEIPMPVPIL